MFQPQIHNIYLSNNNSYFSFNFFVYFLLYYLWNFLMHVYYDLFFFFLMIRRPPRSTLFPYNDALPITSQRPPKPTASSPGGIGESVIAGKFQSVAPRARLSATASIGTAGTNGTRNPGPLRRSRRRSAITDAWTNAKRPRNARLARTAIVSTVRKTSTPAPSTVNATAAGGTSRPP